MTKYMTPMDAFRAKLRSLWQWLKGTVEIPEKPEQKDSK